MGVQSAIICAISLRCADPQSAVTGLYSPTPPPPTLCFFISVESTHADLFLWIQGKSLHSLIPIMVNETHESLDVVIASLVELLHVTAERIDKYAYDLWMLVEEEGSEMFVALETYLMPFWTNMVGSYLWS